MKTIEEIVAALQAIIDGADGEGRDLTDEEMTRYEELEKDLAVAKRSAEFRSRHNAYTTPVSTPAVKAVADKDDTYVRAFDSFMRTGAASSELAQYRAQGELVGSAGGYLVPTTFRDKIVEKRLAFGGFLANVEKMTTDSGEAIEWVTIDDTANIGEITPEGAQFGGGADLVFGSASLGAYKYTTNGVNDLPLKLSVELIQDAAFDIESKLSGWFARRIERAQAIHAISGDGAGEPLGILTPKTAYDEIASNAAGPTYGELVATIHALDPEYRAGAKWLMSDATLAVLRGQLDNNDRPLWLPSDGSMADGLPGGTLLGYPVIIDQAVPDIGDQTKFLAFGNWNEAYVWRTVKGFVLGVDPYSYMNNGYVGYVGWERGDGTVQDANAYVVLAGQNV